MIKQLSNKEETINKKEQDIKLYRNQNKHL